MIRAKSSIQRFILVFGDLAVFEFTLFLTLLIRYADLDKQLILAHLGPFTLVSLVWLMTFYVAGLYDLRTVRQPAKLFRTYIESMFVNLALALAFFYLIPNLGIEPRTNLFLHFSISLLFGYAWRLLYTKTLLTAIPAERVLYIGSLSDSEQVKQLLSGSGLNAVLDTVITSHEYVHQRHDPALTVTDNPDALEQLIKSHGITMIVADSFMKQENLARNLYKTLFLPVLLMDRAELEELTTGRIPLTHVSDLWFLQHLHEQDKIIYEGLKRALDIVLAIPSGLLTLCLFPLVALITKFSSPGPVLIRMTRIGLGGKPFSLIKFRSMHVQSAGGLSEPNGPQFTTDAKTDPRLFPFGRLIRRLRIDELPQIWNILRGDLSFIGPRPERPEFVEQLLERMPYYALRHLTKPGLSGWAQTVYLKPVSNLDENLIKLQYDLYYIKHRSILLDCSILLKTIGIVLKRQGT